MRRRIGGSGHGSCGTLNIDRRYHSIRARHGLVDGFNLAVPSLWIGKREAGGTCLCLALQHCTSLARL